MRLVDQIDVFSEGVNLSLGKLYKSNNERIEFILNKYKTLYDLPIFEESYCVTRELFEYCKRRKFFILIVAFNRNLVFYKRAIGKDLGWELPGSSIKPKGNESFEDAASRILEREIPNVEMSELSSVAGIKKKYVYENKEIVHYGLALMGRIKSPTLEEIEKDEDMKGKFVSYQDDTEKGHLTETQKNIVNIAISKLSDAHPEHIASIDSEIESLKQISPNLLQLHNYIVRPIGSKFSSNIIKKRILSYLKKDYSVLDVACGDDNFIYKLAENSSICIGNDVSWQQIKILDEKMPKNIHNIIFTNHDACDLPFKIKFDITICKNIIHHMASKNELTGILASLKRVSKRILIVDPEDPQKGSLRAKIWNSYYRAILKDQGKKFFNRQMFEGTLRDYFKDDADEISFQSIFTIKGNYMLCFIEMKSDEIKKENINVYEKRTKAIIFDLDGLLVDTEPVFFKAIEYVLRKSGITISKQDYINTDLQNGKSLFEHLISNNIIRDASEGNIFQEKIYEKYKELLSSELKAMPHAIETVKNLQQHFRLAIASSSKKEFIDYILKCIGLADTFEVIISRESVKNLKPLPDCLLQAAIDLNLNIDDCILVEDSLRGVRAARAANMKVIVVPNELTKNASYDKEILLGSLRELTPEYILNRYKK